MRLAITGGLGFIGSNFIRLVLAERSSWTVVNFDAVSYAGNPANLADVAHHPAYRFVKGDVTDAAAVADVLRAGVDAVVHFAAESHVDRSILSAEPFVRTNVTGTQVLLDAVLPAGVRLVHVSTDEVYGSLEPDATPFTEQAPLNPTSPYAASKAAADLLVLACVRTHGLDAVITRCSNNYGPYQFPEKLIPLMITNALEGRPLPVYGDGRQVRDWIHVEDHCRGLLAALERGARGAVYNFGGNAERPNLHIVTRIVAELGADPALITHVADRPAHDRRYAMDATRASRDLAWVPRRSFEDGLAETVRWYRQHEPWWRAVKDGSYRTFYRAWYEERTA